MMEKKGVSLVEKFKNALYRDVKKDSKGVLSVVSSNSFADSYQTLSSNINACVDLKSFESLNKIRCCFVPQVTSEQSDARWVFCREVDGKVIPLTDTTMGSLLREMVFETAVVLSGIEDQQQKETLKAHLNMVSDKEFVSLFLEQYQKNVSSTDSRLLAPRFIDNEWSQESVHLLQGVEEEFSVEMVKKDKVVLDAGRKSAKDVVDLCQRFSKEYGVDSHLSFRALTRGHVFRLIPNHPSLRGVDEKELEKMETMMTSLIHQPISEFPNTIALLESLVALMMKTEEENLPARFKALFSNTGMSCAEFIPKIGKEMLRNWGGVVDDSGEQHFTADNIDTFNCIVISGIVNDHKNVRQLLHFADSNWVKEDAGTQNSIHFCLWFDPFEQQWRVVSAPENESVTSYTIQQYTSMDVLAMPQDVARAANDRILLHWPRRISKRIEQIEGAFIEAYKQLNDTNAKVPQFSGVLPAEISPLLRRAKEVIERKDMTAAARCSELRAIYAALQKRRLELSSTKTSQGIQIPVGYRVSRFGENAKYLRELDVV
jgi:hypothetical protein